MLKQFTKYTVTYHVNGGSGSVPAAQDKQQGDDLMLSNSTLTRDGFAQTGWNTNSDGTGTHYDLGGTYSADADVTLYAEWDFQGSGSSTDPYLIPSTEVWNFLANKVNSGTNYSGKYFRQTENISVTTMVGNSSESKPFSGTYDGDGKTLNLSLNTTTPHTAPFRYIVDANIKNVVTTGSVCSTDNHSSGLVGETDGTCTIRNCRVGANVSGSHYLGGIVGHCWHANISIIGCVYSGTLSPASGNFTGGIIGWGGDGGSHTMTISNCLFAGSLIGTTSFHPVGIVQTTNNTRTVSNTYYTVAHNLSDENTHGNSFVNGLTYKGEFAYSVTGGTDVTVAAAGTPTTSYDVSGLVFYGENGFALNGVLYGGNGDAISLNLTHADAPTGYSFRDYIADHGVLNTTSTPNTLTMPATNVTINARYSISKSISAYTPNGHDGWYLIASPIGTVNPANVLNMTSNTYDIFRFNQNPPATTTQQETVYLELENWADHEPGETEPRHFDLVPGRGYLYANNTDVTLTFIGTPYSGTDVVGLEYSTANQDIRMHGWNLIGNPFGVAATVDRASLKMNTNRDGFEAQTEGASVAAMEGVFVQATATGQSATFTVPTRGSEKAVVARTNIMVSGDKGKVLDNAIIRFDDGEALGKFQLRESSTKVYIPVDGKDYAIANADNQGEIPVNFRAEKNGSYTLSFSNENIDFGYLHLIDNMTGADVDLLVQPSYTFTSKTTDYESRFKLVFGANGPSTGSGTDEPFAFCANGEWIILNEGEATLQVIDIMGRLLLSEEVYSAFRIPHSAFTPGVYVLRIINGNDVRTQKIVVR